MNHTSEPQSTSTPGRILTPWRPWVLACLLGCMTLSNVRAQEPAFPTRPITIYAPFAAGGPSDIFARAVANGMGQVLGQGVVVENRTGAGGNIATSQFLAAKADGYTLLIGASYLVVSPYLYKSVKYDPVKDFVPVSAPIDSHLVFVGNPAGPAMNDAIAAARKSGNPIKLASPGAGTLSHLGGIALGEATGAPMTHVAYRGVAPALTDIMSGQVDMMIDGISSSLPLIKAGRLKALAVPSPARDPLLPDVPTLAELGHPSLDVLAWNAVFVQAGTPQPVVDKLRAAAAQALSRPEIKAELEGRGLFPTTLGPADFRQRIAAETTHWKGVIDKAHITVD